MIYIRYKKEGNKKMSIDAVFQKYEVSGLDT
jgi:hypothetical protein